jgi:hypothetical protein
MAEEKKLTGSQIVGGALGASIGLAKGTSLGLSAAVAAAPFIGPFALLLLPLGAGPGTYCGAKAGSKGLGRVALMAVGYVASDMIGDAISASHDASSSAV